MEIGRDIVTPQREHIDLLDWFVLEKKRKKNLASNL